MKQNNIISEELFNYFKNSEISFYAEESIMHLMKNEYKHYIDFINGRSDLFIYKDQISEICCILLKIINKYEEGFIFDAIKLMNDFMSMLNEQKIIKEIRTKITPPLPLYRMRMSEENLNGKRCEIFHIPLSKRRKVETQRYSITGFPCLYLSSSVYSCWTELDRPPLDKLYVSRFIVKKDVNVLDIGSITPKRLFNYDRYNPIKQSDKMYIETLDEKKQIAALLLWPLIYSCSLHGSSQGDSYKPEYIVPQLLLQWVRKNTKINGIAYLSICLNTECIDPYYCVNYAFPVKKTKDYFCRNLSKIFTLTKPFRCDELNNTMKGHQYVGTFSSSNRLFLDKDIKYEYTTYGKIENNLFYLQDDFLNASCKETKKC